MSVGGDWSIDVYAIQLRAGQTLHVEVTASSDAFGVIIAAAGAQDLLGESGIPLGAFLCNFQQTSPSHGLHIPGVSVAFAEHTDKAAAMRLPLVRGESIRQRSSRYV